LGGQTSGLADIDTFFRSLPPILTDPRTDVTVKVGPSSSVSTSRADRHLRDAIRKCYKELKAEIELADSGQTGFITPEALFPILVKRCTPLTFQDFRFIIQQVFLCFPFIVFFY
jgi:hypothetical protein